MISTANAPVSYGVFSLSRPDRVPVPGGQRLLDLVRDAGYAGIDLGPHGLFGTGPALVDALGDRGLRLCGGWIDLPFAGSDTAFEDAIVAMGPVLDDMARAAALGGPAPRPTIADSGSPERAARPGGGPDLELDAERWRLLARRVERVRQAAADRSLEPTFHHHAGTYVETPREIERFLTDTAMDLTLDTGHLLVGGGDPVELLPQWRDRVNHVHLKDVDTALLARAAGTADPVRDLWEKRVFVPLGDGDLDVGRFMDDLLGSGYEGWLVVEQDVVLLDAPDVDRAVADQVANREVLRRWLP